MAKEQIWLDTGYQIFAAKGPHGLRIERLAKEVNKNKSSFYHFFADPEVFTSRLLAFHLKKVEEIAQKEAAAPNEAALTQIILEHKVDLLFYRQLRVHREQAQYKACFEKANEISLAGLLPIWSEITRLASQKDLAGMVLVLSNENFFLQITDETLTEEWISEYFTKIKWMVQAFQISQRTSSQ